MASLVEILIKAKDQVSAVIDGITGSLDGLGKGAEDAEQVSSDAFGDIFDSAMDAFVGINQGVELAIKAFDLLKGAYEGTVGKVLEIASEVEKFVRISGDAPENMSALRLEAEKADVPFDDLYKAMENLNKNGVPPTLDNLVAIADEYTKLEDPIDRARFLTEQFGSAGDDIAPMLDAIADGVTAVQDAGLIFTEDELQDIRDYEEAVANLGLAWDGLVTTIGMSVIPGLTDFLGQFQNTIGSIGLLSNYVRSLNDAVNAGEITPGEWFAGVGKLMTMDLASAEGLAWLTDQINELNVTADNGIPTFEEYRARMNMLEVSGSNTGKALGEVTSSLESINATKLDPKTLEIDANDGPAKAKLEELARMGIEDKHFDVVAELDTSDVDGYQPPTKYGTITYLPSNAQLMASGGVVNAAAGVAAGL